MSATNHTTNYEFPIFIGTDKPAWLVDWNGAMTAIDTAIHTAEGKADQAGTDIGGIESSITTINSTLTSINNAVSQLRIDTNANTGSINTITSLIGNGEPTTTDKTLIGAINELDSDHDFELKASSATVTIGSTMSGTVEPSITEFKTIQSKSGKLLKLFGTLFISSPNWAGTVEDRVVATITNTGLSIPTAFDVTGFVFQQVMPGNVLGGAYNAILKFKTNGSVDICFKGSSSAPGTAPANMSLNIPPVMLANLPIE